tara:strand:- start:300 stop:515 length:216 start_codon:yes stop_codon:yes gene_type:complete
MSSIISSKLFNSSKKSFSFKLSSPVISINSLMSVKFVSKLFNEEINFSIEDASIETFFASLGLFQKSLSFI